MTIVAPALLHRGLRPKIAPHRMQIMFPLEGPKKRGLASIEAKKKQGKIKWVPDVALC